MAVDVAHVADAGAGLGQQVVVDLEAQCAHAVEVVPHHQVVYLVDGSRGRVLDRQHAIAARAIDDRCEDLLPRLVIGDVGAAEEPVGRGLGVGTFDALAGDLGRGWEEVGRGLARRANLADQPVVRLQAPGLA